MYFQTNETLCQQKILTKNLSILSGGISNEIFSIFAIDLLMSLHVVSWEIKQSFLWLLGVYPSVRKTSWEIVCNLNIQFHTF